MRYRRRPLPLIAAIALGSLLLLALLADPTGVEAKKRRKNKDKDKRAAPLAAAASSVAAGDVDTSTSTTMIDAELAEPLSPHDVSRYVEWANFVTQAASFIQTNEHAHAFDQNFAGEAAAAALSASASVSAAGSASVSSMGGAAMAGDPDAEDRDEKPTLHKPDIVIHDEEWKGNNFGQPRPHDWHPHLEGFRPPGGFFMQDPGCDRLMRIWLDTCSFADQKSSVYWQTPDKIFPTGDVDDEVTTAKYIGNLLKQDFESEPRSHSAKQNVGHYPNGEKFLVPDDGEPPEERFTDKPFLSKGA